MKMNRYTWCVLKVRGSTYLNQNESIVMSNMPLFNGRRTLVMLCLVLLQACESSVEVSKAVKVTPAKAGTEKVQSTPAANSGSNSGSTVAAPPAPAAVGTSELNLESAWYGSVATGTTLDKAVEIHVSNAASAITNAASAITNPAVTLPIGFSFVGGSYPGTGGTCGATITSDCTLMIRFAPAAVQSYDSQMSFAFDNDGKRYTSSISLKAAGALIIGAADFATNPGVQQGLSGPTDFGAAGSKYYLVDNANHRVVFYDSEPSTNNPTPSFVLGQVNTSGVAKNAGGISGSSLNAPTKGLYCGGKFFVVDQGNNRVLVWNGVPTASMQAANFALGQADFAGSSANPGVTASAGGFSSPRGLACYTVGAVTMLFVSDTTNHRVLVWNNVATLSMGSAADQVIGQADFVSNQYNRTNSTTAASDGLRSPSGMVVAGTKLFIADTTNRRVVAYDLPATDANLTLPSTTQAFSVSSVTLSSPQDVSSDGARLIVADTAKNRVLIWTAIPNALSSPNWAIGQADLTASSANKGSSWPTDSSISNPRGVSFANSKLYIADSTNNRLLVYNTVPGAHNASASRVIGQSTSSLTIRNGRSAIGSTDVSSLRVYADANRLIVPDSERNRVLIWNTFPTSNNQAPDIVLGQADFTSGLANRGGAATCATMSGPNSVFWDGAGLYVGDDNNHRVLVWNAASIATGATADSVIGQPDCATITPTNTTPGRFNAPRGVYAVGGKLFVSESGNQRISVFDNLGSLPAVQTTAAFVLKWTTSSCPITSMVINNPEQVFSDGTRLFIPERGNGGSTGSRLLVFSSIPTAATDCPSEIWGQASASVSATNQYINQVGGGAFDSNGSLYMADRGSNMRIEKWISSRLPSGVSEFQTPDSVWGALDISSFSGLSKFAEYGGYGYTDSYTPAIAGDKIVIPDRSGRIYIVPKF